MATWSQHDPGRKLRPMYKARFTQVSSRVLICSNRRAWFLIRGAMARMDVSGASPINGGIYHLSSHPIIGQNSLFCSSHCGDKVCTQHSTVQMRSCGWSRATRGAMISNARNRRLADSEKRRFWTFDLMAGKMTQGSGAKRIVSSTGLLLSHHGGLVVPSRLPSKIIDRPSSTKFSDLIVERRPRAFQTTSARRCAAVQATLDRMIAEGGGRDMRKRIVRADAELRVIRCVGVPGVENGVAVRCDGTLVDITQQRTATQELRRSQAYREQAEALSHTGSFGWNLSSREWYSAITEQSPPTGPPARRSRAPRSARRVGKIDAYWRASLYLCLGMLYLQDNPLLREPLKARAHQASTAGPLGLRRRPGVHVHPLQPADQEVRPECHLHLRSGTRCAGGPVPSLSRGDIFRDLPGQE